MNKKTKKVFILKNFKSQYIEQAIFVLKEQTPEPESCSDVVREAEMIVEGYLKNLGYESKGKENKKFTKITMIINITAILFVIAAVLALSRLY